MSGNTIGIQPGATPADLQETRAENGEVVSFQQLALRLEWRGYYFCFLTIREFHRRQRGVVSGSGTRGVEGTSHGGRVDEGRVESAE